MAPNVQEAAADEDSDEEGCGAAAMDEAMGAEEQEEEEKEDEVLESEEEEEEVEIEVDRSNEALLTPFDEPPPWRNTPWREGQKKPKVSEDFVQKSHWKPNSWWGAQEQKKAESYDLKSAWKSNSWKGTWEHQQVEEEEEVEVVVEEPLLPIHERREEVVEKVCRGPKVCCIHGETGCGKSTQVPKILLEEASAAAQPIRIAVSQPRRVAALNLAKRVSQELDEDRPGQTVGYRIGGESVPGEHIDFCTVGYLLQLFINAPEEFGCYTHIVLDEVHERSAESDMLCLLVRLFISTSYKDTRVVVMSATLQSDLFLDYFASLCEGGPSKLFVGARVFPVTEHFLEDLPEVYAEKLWNPKVISQRVRDLFANDGKKKPRIDTKHCEKMQGIVVDLLRAIGTPGGTVLVFLPGIAEISSLWEEARELEAKGFQVYPLHSMIPREEQEMVFAKPDPSVVRVVLATDIAESSITLPNVVAVLDLGLHRRVDHDSSRGMSALATKWISRAAATQRSGRAGRTQPGICCRLYTKAFFDDMMHAFEPPETASMPMDKLYLQSEQLVDKLGSSFMGAPDTAEKLMAQMIQAPDTSAVASARGVNAELGAITEANEAASITALGRLCLQLPVDLRTAKLVWLGCLWGCAADAIVLASVLSSTDPFASPSPIFIRDQQDFVERLRASTSARLLFDGGQLSEPLMMRQLFLEWLAQFHQSQWVYGNKKEVFRARRTHTAEFSYTFSLSRGRMEHVVTHVQELALRTCRICDPESGAALQLRGLIRGLGYLLNDRGDLQGISWDAWERFSIEDVFTEDPAYLKSFLAASFGDQLLLGAYGQVAKDLVQTRAPAAEKEAKKQLELEKRELKAIGAAGFDVQQSALFPPEDEEALVGGGLQAFVQFLLGEAPHNFQGKVALEGGGGCAIVELLPFEADRWQPLESRPSAPLLENKLRLPPGFSLLSQWDKGMREMAKAKMSGWVHGQEKRMRHPCQLRWEWMYQSFEGPPTKPRIVRHEAVCDRKNALGIIGHVQEMKEGVPLKRVVAFAVCASIHGGEVKGKAFPTGVTFLSAGHIGFVLATANLQGAKLGLRRFGFTSLGALAILHRSVRLPSGCLDKLRWEHISRLRDALRAEMVAPEEHWSKTGGTWTKEATVIKDSPVEACARALFEVVPTERLDGGGVLSEGVGVEAVPVAEEDSMNPCVTELVAWTVDLSASPGRATSSSSGQAKGAGDTPVVAFAPLAPWSELRNRCEQLTKGASLSVSANGGGSSKPDRGSSLGVRRDDGGRRRFVEGSRKRSPSRHERRRKESKRSRSARRDVMGAEIVMNESRHSMVAGDRAKVMRVSSKGDEYVLSNGKRVPKSGRDRTWRWSRDSAVDRQARRAS